MTIKNILLECVQEIVCYADEIRGQDRVNEVEFGTLLGYAECLTVLQECMSPEERKEFGLDFDIEKRFLL